MGGGGGGAAVVSGRAVAAKKVVSVPKPKPAGAKRDARRLTRLRNAAAALLSLACASWDIAAQWKETLFNDTSSPRLSRQRGLELRLFLHLRNPRKHPEA